MRIPNEIATLHFVSFAMTTRNYQAAETPTAELNRLQDHLATPTASKLSLVKFSVSSGSGEDFDTYCPQAQLG